MRTKAEEETQVSRMLPDSQIIRVFGPGYDSNEAATALTLSQKLIRWKTAKALGLTGGLHVGSTWLSIKMWPLLTTKTAGATTEIGSFSGAQSLNDVVPLILAAGGLMLLVAAFFIIPMVLGVWWWRREPYRMPWDVPMVNTGEIMAQTPRMERQEAIALSGVDAKRRLLSQE